MSKHGILSYGAYVPYWRLDRSAIAGVLGGKGGKGTRSVASYDEDTTSMGVEAARYALATDGVPAPSTVLFATATPSYADKTNATTIAAALDLGTDVFAADMAGAVRSGVAAMKGGLISNQPTLVITSDIRMGRPSSAEERDGGDAAAAFVTGVGEDADLVAECLGGASVSDEFLDRWRTPGDAASHVWEERFGEQQYLPLAARAFEQALERTGLKAEDLDRVLVSGLHGRAVKSFTRKAKLTKEQLGDDLLGSVGNTGTAHAGLLLAAALDGASIGQTIALVVLADGADVLIVRTTEGLTSKRAKRSVASQIAAGSSDLSYARFLTWRGSLELEPPRRPDPDRPAGPPSHQREGWKFAFVGTRCTECGLAHLPPQRVCVSCRAVDKMTRESYADSKATVATYTRDFLAFSMSPPVVAAVIDFDGGGRYASELTDLDPDSVAVGDRVEMTFRRLYTSGGVHNYFWKARPVMEESE